VLAEVPVEPGRRGGDRHLEAAQLDRQAHRLPVGGVDPEPGRQPDDLLAVERRGGGGGRLRQRQVAGQLPGQRLEDGALLAGLVDEERSEERRVGEEWRAGRRRHAASALVYCLWTVRRRR